MPLRLLRAAAVAMVLLGWEGLDARQAPPRPEAWQEAGLRVRHVRDGIYMVSGAGGNVTVSAGPDGVLLVDSGASASAQRVLAAVRRLSHLPIMFIVNTSAHPDHVGGNQVLGEAGVTYTGAVGAGIRNAEGATIIAHENVLTQMSRGAAGEVAPAAAWPNNTYHVAFMKLYRWFNGNGIHIAHQPAATSDGDSIVYFRRAEVISTGEVFNTTTYPRIDVARGGSIQGVVRSLQHLLDISVSDFLMEGGTLFIPGHGRVADSADVAQYRDAMGIIRDRVEAMVKQGMTLEQVKAARPTAEYDDVYGATTGPWTTGMFIEAVYRSFPEQK